MAYSLQEHVGKDTMIEFCRKHHITRIAVFGSAIRDELRSDSDLDVLVEFDERFVPGYFKMCRMEHELTEIVGRKVDLRTPEELSRYFREDVMREAHVEYEEA